MERACGGDRRSLQPDQGRRRSRLVTSCPGFSDDLGSERHNQLLDVLTPHTVRQPPARFWSMPPRQIGELRASFHKPVIDDEPARCGLTRFGALSAGQLLPSTLPYAGHGGGRRLLHLSPRHVPGGYWRPGGHRPMAYQAPISVPSIAPVLDAFATTTVNSRGPSRATF